MKYSGGKVDGYWDVFRPLAIGLRQDLLREIIARGPNNKTYHGDVEKILRVIRDIRVLITR